MSACEMTRITSVMYERSLLAGSGAQRSDSKNVSERSCHLYNIWRFCVFMRAAALVGLRFVKSIPPL